MKPCALHLVDRFAYAPTTSGLLAPSLEVALFARPMGKVIVTAFVVDTGCDVPLVIARPLRNQLRALGVVARRATIDWGGPVDCEVYSAFAHIGGRWQPCDAFFPAGPETEENLAGLPLLEGLTVCLRAPQRELFTAQA